MLAVPKEKATNDDLAYVSEPSSMMQMMMHPAGDQSVNKKGDNDDLAYVS
jgi:hypothetical protein